MTVPAWILTLDCEDRPGIVAAVSGFLAARDGFIPDSQQYAALDSGRFFMRVEFKAVGEPFETAALREATVARGLVAFALGTDTAGSGRVPAGLNNIVGLKPTVGALSSLGVVPACRTLDCVSIFALTVADAVAIEQAAALFDRTLR